MIPVVLLSLPVWGQDQRLPDGFHQFRYPNGVVSSEGYIRDGRPDGYWISYYVTGIKKSEGRRTSFLLDSTWVFYDNAGDTLEKINYHLGSRNGYTYTYRKDAREGLYIYSRELYAADRREGTAYIYHPDGSVMQTINYINGRKEGLSREFDTGGNVITLIEYSNDLMVSRTMINRLDNSGMRQGEWREFHDNGSVRVEKSYRNDMLHGFYREFDRRGRVVISLLYDEGRIVEGEAGSASGIEIVNRYNDDNVLIYSGPYRDDTPVGIHREYDDDGDIVNAMVYNDMGIKVSEGIIDMDGNRNGTWKEFFDDGTVSASGQYSANRRSGRWEFYNEEGQVIQTGQYSNGRTHGLWRWYYDDGSLLREEEYYQGRRDGQYIEYCPEGEIIAEGAYADGERNGEWKFSVSGHTEKGSYILGLREGLWQSWYDNGQLRFRGSYTQGQAEGQHILYHDNGRLKEERFYIRGLRERVWRRFTDEGVEIIAVSYRNDMVRAINGMRVQPTESDVRVIR